MNIDILDDEIFSDIARNCGYDLDNENELEAATAQIVKMSPEEAWERYCVWNGLLGSFHYSLREAYQNIFEACNPDALTVEDYDTIMAALSLAQSGANPTAYLALATVRSKVSKMQEKVMA